jgi:putative FmdB family regulatory protein
MPLYQYRCSNCNVELEIQQRITEPALTDCPNCETNGLETGNWLRRGLCAQRHRLLQYFDKTSLSFRKERDVAQRQGEVTFPSPCARVTLGCAGACKCLPIEPPCFESVFKRFKLPFLN